MNDLLVCCICCRVAHHLPRYVCSLSSFPKVHSVALKKYNWEMLERSVLRHLGIRLSASDIDALSSGSDSDAILSFLALLRDKINETLKQRHFRPSSASGRSSRCSSRGGSQQHLDRVGLFDGGGARNNAKSDDRPKVLDELDKDQLVEKLYAKVRVQEAQLRKKDEQIEALGRKVDKLLEMVCEESKSAKRESISNWENNGKGVLQDREELLD